MPWCSRDGWRPGWWPRQCCCWRSPAPSRGCSRRATRLPRTSSPRAPPAPCSYFSISGMGRSTCGLQVQILEYLAHPPRQRLDLPQARHHLRTELVGGKEHDLRFGEYGGERVGQVMPKPADFVSALWSFSSWCWRHYRRERYKSRKWWSRRSRTDCHKSGSDVAQKILGGRPLLFGIGCPKQHAAAPDRVFGPPYHQTYGDELSVEPNGGQIMNDCFAGIRTAISNWLSGHSAVGLVWAKIRESSADAIEKGQAVSGFRCQVSGTTCLTPDTRHLTPDTRHLFLDAERHRRKCDHQQSQPRPRKPAARARQGPVGVEHGRVAQPSA